MLQADKLPQVISACVMNKVEMPSSYNRAERKHAGTLCPPTHSRYLLNERSSSRLPFENHMSARQWGHDGRLEFSTKSGRAIGIMVTLQQSSTAFTRVGKDGRESGAEQRVGNILEDDKAASCSWYYCATWAVDLWRPYSVCGGS